MCSASVTSKESEKSSRNSIPSAVIHSLSSLIQFWWLSLFSVWVFANFLRSVVVVFVSHYSKHGMIVLWPSKNTDCSANIEDPTIRKHAPAFQAKSPASPSVGFFYQRYIEEPLEIQRTLKEQSALVFLKMVNFLFPLNEVRGNFSSIFADLLEVKVTKASSPLWLGLRLLSL